LRFVIHHVTKSKAGDLSRIYYVDFAKGRLHAVRAERFEPTDDILPATDESKAKLAAFCSKLKANKPKALPLVNPTKEEAEKILALDERSRRWGYVVHCMTAEQFANVPSWSKRTEEIDRGGLSSDLPAVCRVRFLGTGFTPGMVVLTDKKQTPLPCDLSQNWTEARRIARAAFGRCIGTCEILAMAREVAGVLVHSHSDAAKALRDYCRKTWPAAFGVTEETAETGADLSDAEESATVEESETLETEEANA
jgi:hypothetical protein